jgi:hypothetical protein
MTTSKVCILDDRVIVETGEQKVVFRRDDPESAADRIADLQQEVERLRLSVDLAECREQLREQTKSFCIHCGQLFEPGKAGLAAFREHIAECNAHPLHPMAVEIKKLRAGIAAVQKLIEESQGVDGLHLNGDVAAWDDLRSGGHFEEWLKDFDESLSVLDDVSS